MMLKPISDHNENIQHMPGIEDLEIQESESSVTSKSSSLAISGRIEKKKKKEQIEGIDESLKKLASGAEEMISVFKKVSKEVEMTS